MKLECRDGPMEDRYENNKIRMLSDTFVFDNVNKYTMATRRSKTNMFDGITCRGTLQVKKSQRTAMIVDHFLSY